MGRRTIIPLKPLAPPPLFPAISHTSLSAGVVNLISMPEYPKSASYCLASAPLTSVSTRKRSETDSGCRTAVDGSRETNLVRQIGSR